MIEAVFAGRAQRSAAVSGAYQYDTGQRLRMHGLPPPEELAQRDDFLSGDVVTVQAQYAYGGDSQTEMRLAAYDEETGTWSAAVPDAYLMHSEDVHVYVYVGYGQTQEEMRAKTCYEAVFRPVGRPAPASSVTPAQKNAWDAVMQEVSLAIADVGAAASNANGQAQAAKEAAQAANDAAEDTNSLLEKLDATVVTAKTLPMGSAATVSVSDKGTHKEMTFGIPKGDPGVLRINGKEVTDMGEITLTAQDVGALDDTYRPAQTFKATLLSSRWNVNSYGFATQYVMVDDIFETDAVIVDVDTSKSLSERLLSEWTKVASVEVSDGVIHAIALGGKIDTDIPIRLMCLR